MIFENMITMQGIKQHTVSKKAQRVIISNEYCIVNFKYPEKNKTATI